MLPGGRGLEIKYSAPENIEPKQSTNDSAASNGGSTTITIPVLYAGFDFCTTVGVEELAAVLLPAPSPTAVPVQASSSVASAEGTAALPLAWGPVPVPAAAEEKTEEEAGLFGAAGDRG